MFYFFGAIGLVWSFWWEQLMGDIAVRDPEFMESLEGGADKTNATVPWRAFFRNQPVQALAFTHFCNNWCASLLNVAWSSDKIAEACAAAGCMHSCDLV